MAASTLTRRLGSRSSTIPSVAFSHVAILGNDGAAEKLREHRRQVCRLKRGRRFKVQFELGNGLGEVGDVVQGERRYAQMQ